MKASQWEQARDIFDAALDLPNRERDAFVRGTCADDSVLLAEVEALLEADAEAEERGFLNAGWLPENLGQEADLTLHPGDLISDRFRIVRQVGEGGMGRVYEAFDTALGVSVALKTLRPEVATDREVLKRFHQEVRIAHRITHPNVCRTFHLDREHRPADKDGRPAADLTYITMEYLSGETLQQVLNRDGPLQLERALNIARQMADALSAAHRSGIIHRDIKPGNVMLCPPEEGSSGDERVVITDFGLAKAGTAANVDLSAISHAGAAMGTLAYMAPEQLAGGEVTPATDIYAFGLVLFEMVAGKKAFPDSTHWEAVMRRLTESPPALLSHAPGSPAAWQEAIVGCLRIEPKERFLQASDVVKVLEGGRPEQPGHFSKRSYPARPTASRGLFKLRRATLAGVLIAISIVVVALIWIGFRFYFQRAQSPVASGALVYLAPVKNLTGEKRLDNVTELVRAGMDQSAHVNLLDIGQASEILSAMQQPPEKMADPMIAREIAMRAGASRVLLLTLEGRAGEYRLDVDVQQPDNTPKHYRNHWLKSFYWHENPQPVDAAIMSSELTANVRMASDWIRKQAGESGNDIARLDAPPEDVTTSNWGALQDFATAQRLIAEGNLDGAIRALQDATIKDPHFALAFSELASNLYAVFRTEEALAAYNKAISLEQESRLSVRERYLIIAEHAADTGDYELAASAYKSYTDIYPNDFLGWFYLAYPLTESGKPEQALTALNKSIALRPNRGGTMAMIALTYLAMGKIDEARQTTARIWGIGAKDDALYTEGIENFLDGQYDRAVEDFRALHKASTQIYKAASYASLGRVFAEQGKWDLALEAFERGAQQSREASDPGNYTARHVDQAHILCRLKRYADCFTQLDAAQSERLDPIHVILESSTLSLAAHDSSSQIRRQAISRFENLLAVVKHLPSDVLMDIARHRLTGELEWVRGDQKRAVEEFHAADKLDAPVSDRGYLSRILLASGRGANAPRLVPHMREEGMTKLEQTIDHPANVWREAWSYSPGILADGMETFLAACHGPQDRGGRCAKVATQYHNLRSTAVGEDQPRAREAHSIGAESPYPLASLSRHNLTPPKKGRIEWPTNHSLLP